MGGIKGFEQVKYLDEIKNKYCLDNNINILRIPYTKFNNIEKILEENITNATTN
jgi:hypothetical protein